MGSGSWTSDSFKSYASRKSYKLTDNDTVESQRYASSGYV